MRDVRARLSDSDNVMSGFEEVAGDVMGRFKRVAIQPRDQDSVSQGVLELEGIFRRFRWFAKMVCDVREVICGVMVNHEGGRGSTSKVLLSPTPIAIQPQKTTFVLASFLIITHHTNWPLR